MDLDPLMRTALLILLIGGFGLVLYLELRYMRKKLRSRIDTRLLRDDAYNSLTTTKAIARILRERGDNTASAEILLLKAEGAYERGEYALCKEMVEKAKSSLEEVRLQERARESEVIPAGKEVERSAEEISMEQEEQREQEELMTLYEKEKKLPENYLQSKFMIARVRSTIEPLSTTMDVSEARNLLGQAEISFRAGEYTEAFKFACRAKRNLDSVAGSMGKLDGLELIRIERSEGETPSPGEPCDESEEAVEEKEGESVDLLCAECGAMLSEEDRFCGKCGARVEKKLKCPSCGAMSKAGDRFCRQCGHQLY